MKTFSEKCYELLRKIPKGKVTTYFEIAKALDCKSYRAVGNAMAKNKDLVKNPCYKVVSLDGSLNSYQLGLDKKKKLLEKDGISFVGKKVDLKKHLHKF